MANIETHSTPIDSKPQPIGGFLIFVAIGLILSLIQNLGHVLTSLRPLLKERVWEVLTTPTSSAYHPYWKPVLLFGIGADADVLILNAIVLGLFFRKERAFPKVVVFSLPVIFILGLAGYYLSSLIPAVAESSAHAAEPRKLVLRFVAMHIWIPYFLVSKRVARTFVR